VVGWGGGVIEHKMCVLILLQILSEIFLSLRIIQRNIVINVNMSSCRVPAILFIF